MSYVNSTEFYNIPLFEETDLYNPMDYNNAFEAVDTALHGAVVDAENAVSTAGSASDVATAAAAAVEQLSGELAEADGKITVLQTNVLNLDNKVDDIKDDALDMICAFVEPTAQVGEDPESTHNYAIGDYFRYNDVLYRATAAIAVGDTIIPNTNCVATNVSSELIDLNNIDSPNKSNTWGTSQSVTIGTSFTAPSDGVVSIKAYQACCGRIVVNGVVCQSLVLESQAAATVGVVYRVNTGDTIVIEQDSGSLSVHEFIPVL